MDNGKVVNGLIVFGIGLLASSISSFLEHFAIPGTATDFTKGLFDRFSVVAFCIAIFLLVRSRSVMRK